MCVCVCVRVCQRESEREMPVEDFVYSVHGKRKKWKNEEHFFFDERFVFEDQRMSAY